MPGVSPYWHSCMTHAGFKDAAAEVAGSAMAPRKHDGECVMMAIAITATVSGL